MLQRGTGHLLPGLLKSPAEVEEQEVLGNHKHYCRNERLLCRLTQRPGTISPLYRQEHRGQ